MENLANEIQCECGYIGAPEMKMHLKDTDIIIGVLLVLFFFPIGLIFFAVKLFTAKAPFCPKCGRLHTQSAQQAAQPSRQENSNQIGQTVINAAKNPELRNSVKGLGKSLSNLKDSFDL